MSEYRLSDYIVINFFCVALHGRADSLVFFKKGMSEKDFIAINKKTLNDMVPTLEKRYTIAFRNKSLMTAGASLFLKHIGYHLYAHGANFDPATIDKTLISYSEFRQMK